MLHVCADVVSNSNAATAARLAVNEHLIVVVKLVDIRDVAGYRGM